MTQSHAKGEFRMSMPRTLVGFLLGAALSSMAQGIAKPRKLDDAMAKINGRVVARSELYDKEASTLLQQRYDHYRAEREALDRLIDNELLETEARHRGVTVQQLIAQEITTNVKDPTEEQLEVFYEGLQIDQTFEAVKRQLIARLRQARTKKSREAFLSSLRSQAKIEVLLSPPYTDVASDDAPARGQKNAPVAIVEFADFECPFCRQMQPEIERLVKEYDGKLTLFYKEFPLAIHPHAEKASEAARCAGEQGAFWAYHDILFRDGSGLEVAQLKESARVLGLNVTRFNLCLDSAAQAPAIQKDLAQGLRLGLAGTPGFFINGHFLSGVVSYETLREIVEQQLESERLTN
jgi:protein-disulfide isomerase